MITIIDHSSERIKERVGIKSAKHRQILAEAAYAVGQRIYETEGISRLLMENRLRPQWPTRELVLYRDQIYVFQDEVLITVLPKDANYVRLMEKIRFKEHRKQKKEERAHAA